MKRILVIVFSVLVTVICSGFVVPEKLLLEGTALQSAEYIRSHIDVINDYAVNNGYSGNRTTARIQPILIFNGEKYEDGYFIDFNDDNGYITVGDQFSIYDLSFEGESVAQDGILNLFEYSVHDGYNYEGREIFTFDIKNEHFSHPSDYDGTDSMGKIIDLPKYVKDRYGSEYTLYAEKRVTTMYGESQYARSVYIQSKDGFRYSEGNCGLISVGNYLKYLRNNRGYTDIPYNTNESYDAQTSEENLFNNRSSDSSYTVRNTLSMPIALADIRREAYRLHGGPEGLTVWQSKDLLNFAMERYGYSLRFKTIEVWSYNTVTSRIDSNKALLWSVLWQEVYGDHTMFVSGYQTYRKATQFLWWTNYDYREFFVLKDGHSSEDRYYDFNGGANGNTWLGAFIVESENEE